jgi:hypothetical protein
MGPTAEVVAQVNAPQNNVINKQAAKWHSLSI